MAGTGRGEPHQGVRVRRLYLQRVFGDGTMFEFNGNTRNFGLIDNLPEGCCGDPHACLQAGCGAAAGRQAA